jgi:AcrR family transcriptional regulator
MKAYCQDFIAIASLMTDTHPAQLTVADITKDSMRTAFAAYARDHEAASIRRCWSTWNVLCTFLYTGRLVHRADIVRSALSIAQRRGIARVTMRSLADELGVSVATAYHHVKDKAELLDLMGDAAMSEVPRPPAELAWDERLILLSQEVRKTSARYPGLFSNNPFLGGPQIQRLLQYTVEILQDAGLVEDAIPPALSAVATFIWGQLLLDSLSRDPLPSRDWDTAQSSPAEDSFGIGFAVVFDGIRSRSVHRQPRGETRRAQRSTKRPSTSATP